MKQSKMIGLAAMMAVGGMFGGFGDDVGEPASVKRIRERKAKEAEARRQRIEAERAAKDGNTATTAGEGE